MTVSDFKHHGKGRALRAARSGLVVVLLAPLPACESTEWLGTLRTPAVAGSGGSGGETASAGGEAGVTALEPPRIVPALSDPSARDTDPSFTEDLRELYFMSERSGNKELWRALRSDRDAEWQSPELVAELNTTGEEENPTISNDGRDIWFFTDRDRALGSLWHASRAARGERFSDPQPVPELTTGPRSSDVSVAVDPTRTLFILNSKLPGNQPYQLYSIDRDGPDGEFAEPVLLSDVVVTDTDEFDPDLRRGGRFLAFDSRRNGLAQIYFSAREQIDEPFPASAPFEALRSDFEDGAAAFSEDLDYVMFSSDRSGDIEIYEAKLAPNF